MDARDARRRLEAAEDRSARAWRRLKYLRDSELYGYQVGDQYRLALREYQAAQRQLLAARYAAAVTRPEPLAA